MFLDATIVMFMAVGCGSSTSRTSASSFSATVSSSTPTTNASTVVAASVHAIVIQLSQNTNGPLATADAAGSG